MDGQSIQPTRRRPCQGNPHGHRPGTLAALALMRGYAPLMHPRLGEPLDTLPNSETKNRSVGGVGRRKREAFSWPFLAPPKRAGGLLEGR